MATKRDRAALIKATSCFVGWWYSCLGSESAPFRQAPSKAVPWPLSPRLVSILLLLLLVCPRDKRKREASGLDGRTVSVSVTGDWGLRYRSEDVEVTFQVLCTSTLCMHVSHVLMLLDVQDGKTLFYLGRQGQMRQSHLPPHCEVSVVWRSLEAAELSQWVANGECSVGRSRRQWDSQPLLPSFSHFLLPRGAFPVAVLRHHVQEYLPYTMSRVFAICLLISR